MPQFLLWYFTLTFLGLVTFPLVYWLLPGLPDRGYAFSRTLGLLVWGYVFWILASLGILQNNPGGLVFALIVLLILSGWAATHVGVDGFRAWWERQRGTVLVAELLFLAAFGLMTYIRGANPDLASTEKPMELMFINSILRSPTFPPHDSWLAGYAISYYYFGYVMAAMLTMLTNVSASVGFSLMLATVFALGAMGAWGVAHNLLEAVKQGRGEEAKERRRDGATSINAFSALLAPLFVLIVSNVEGFLEILHTRGVGWNGGEGPFWKWLNLKELANPPFQLFSWPPEGRGGWWWWRASRVITDLNYRGEDLEIIDEFPYFSFILGDLHPHVLAIPFAFLAMGLALNLFLQKSPNPQNPSQDLAIPQEQKPDGINLFGFRLHLNKPTFFLGALALGGLAFLNTWDFPIYMALFAGAYVLKRAGEEGWSWTRLADFAGLGAALGITGIVLYLPFYIGFSSQAGGILPNLLNPTRGAHLWVMFGTLFLPLLIYLIVHLQPRRDDLRRGFLLASGLIVLLFVFVLVFAGAAALTPQGAEAVNLLGAPDAAALLRESLSRRLTGFGGWGTLLVLLGLAVSGLVQKRDSDADAPPVGISLNPGHFAVLMILIGTLLVLGPEFVYLRDQFGWRMNTVFKFYYQTWLLWGTAAGFASAYLLQNLRGATRAGLAVIVMLSITLGLFYPILSTQTRTNNFQQPWTLDGTGISHLSGDDVAAVEWLKSAPLGTLVEAVSTQTYSGYSRISGHSGMPTLLGWPGHESQWRGGYDEQGSRMADVETIYRTGNWAQTETLLQQYNIRYVYIGNLERTTYAVNEAKFQRYMHPVYELGSVVIYEVP